MRISDLAIEAHQNAKDKGWWDQDRPIPECIALIHSEASEALEDYRDGRMALVFEADGKPTGFASELADIVIRTLDLAQSLGINMEEALAIKHQYNTTRPIRHGGKKC